MERYIIDTGLEKDIEKIQAWVNTYSHKDSMPMERYLKPWYYNKSKWLLPMFNNQLVYKEEVRFGKNKLQIQKELANILKEKDFNILRNNYYDILKYFLFENGKPYSDSRHTLGWTSVPQTDEERKNNEAWLLDMDTLEILSSYINDIVLSENQILSEYTVNRKDLDIVIHEGQKPFRAINTVLKTVKPVLLKKYPDIFTEQFFDKVKSLLEKLRVAHSQILNDKNLKGTLCVSIHPLDYITMSDNDYGWTSCMRWSDEDEEPGCYHAGTIEMMNAPNVVVAYLDGVPWYPLGEEIGSFSNKKWRELFIVDHDFIIGIKGYPYQHHKLEAKVINILKSMAEKNLGFSYVDNIDRCCPEHLYYPGDDNEYHILTHHYMYNDLESNGYRIMWSTEPDYRNVDRAIGDYTYGDEAYCTVCGEPLDNEERTTCYQHSGYCKCEYCGEYYEADEMMDVDGRIYCPHCYANSFRSCTCCGEFHHRDEKKLHYLTYQYNTQKFESDSIFCESCIQDLIKNKLVKKIGDKYIITSKADEAFLNKHFDMSFIRYITNPMQQNLTVFSADLNF